jgi:5-hydroxyisourate hydrolase
MKKLSLLVSSLLFSSLVFAQNPLSVHVLNLETGLPSAGVKVTLEEQKEGKWVQLAEGETNQQGRIPALYPEDKKIENAVYKVTFKTGDWFKQHKQESFFPEVPVVFKADGSVEHYHIPLLMSSYGYSTYRGN